MKKTIVGVIFLITLNIVFATYTCEEICDNEKWDCYDGVCSGLEGAEETACLANCDTIHTECIFSCDDCIETNQVWVIGCLISFCGDDESTWGPEFGVEPPPYYDCAESCYISYQYYMSGCDIEGNPFIYDTDGDGILDMYEDVDVNNSLNDDDTDGDGDSNYYDADDDGDGIPTSEENADPNGDGNPDDALDSDSDSIPDYLDSDPVEEVTEGEESECTIDADCPAGYECIGEGCVEIEAEEEIEEVLEVPIPVSIPPCVETDNGQDYITKGKILSGMDKTDKCMTSDKLRERYCSTTTTYTSEDVSCSGLYGANWVCEDGECIEKEASKFPWWIIIMIIAYIYFKNKKGKRKRRK